MFSLFLIKLNEWNSIRAPLIIYRAGYPLTIHLESVTTIIVTRCQAELYGETNAVNACYYAYLASIYGLQIIRVILTKFLKRYSRGS
jgi:hypothetical protein